MMPRFELRCSDEELARWRLVASGEGMSLAELIRHRLEGGHPQMTKESVIAAVQRTKVKPASGGLCARCGRIGAPSCPACIDAAKKRQESAVEVFSHLE